MHDIRPTKSVFRGIIVSRFKGICFNLLLLIASNNWECKLLEKQIVQHEIIKEVALIWMVTWLGVFSFFFVFSKTQTLGPQAKPGDIVAETLFPMFPGSVAKWETKWENICCGYKTAFVKQKCFLVEPLAKHRVDTNFGSVKQEKYF